MNASDSLKFINGIELSLPVDTWVMEGVHIWPLIRIELMFKLYRDSINNLNSTSRFQRLFNRSFSYFRYLRSFILDRQKNDSISKRNVVFLSDGVSFAHVMDVWYEKFCDPIIDYCKKNNLSTLLLNPLDNYYIPRHSSSVFIQPFLDFSLLKQFIYGKKKFNEQ